MWYLTGQQRTELSPFNFLPGDCVKFSFCNFYLVTSPRPSNTGISDITSQRSFLAFAHHYINSLQGHKEIFYVFLSSTEIPPSCEALTGSLPKILPQVQTCHLQWNIWGSLGSTLGCCLALHAFLLGSPSLPGLQLLLVLTPQHWQRGMSTRSAVRRQGAKSWPW